MKLIKAQRQLKYYDQMGVTIKSILQTTGPLTYGCYYSAFEFSQIINDYFSTLGDIDKLFYNLVHHMGKIYDNSVAIVDLARYGDPTQLSYWKNLGYYSGDSLNQICYKPADYEPMNPRSLAF
jgi:hypothetical protein